MKDEFWKHGFARGGSSEIDFDTEYMLNKAYDFIENFRLSKECRPRDINFVNGEINSFHRLHACQELVDYFESKGVLQLCSDILGGDVEIRASELFAKPGGVGLKVPFHQDNWLWCLKEGRALTIWIACKPVSVINGGVTYLAGSHHKVVMHEPSNHPGTSQKIPDDLLDGILSAHDWITPVLNTGDFLIHHSQLVHGSAANTSPYPRNGITIQVKAKSDSYDDFRLKEYENSLMEQISKR